MLNNEMLKHLALALVEHRVFDHREEAGVLTEFQLIAQFLFEIHDAFDKDDVFLLIVKLENLFLFLLF